MSHDMFILLIFIIHADWCSIINRSYLIIVNKNTAFKLYLLIRDGVSKNICFDATILSRMKKRWIPFFITLLLGNKRKHYFLNFNIFKFHMLPYYNSTFLYLLLILAIKQVLTIVLSICFRDQYQSACLYIRLIFALCVATWQLVKKMEMNWRGMHMLKQSIKEQCLTQSLQ